MDNDILLSIKGLKTYFPIQKGLLKRVVGHVKAVNDVDLDIHNGETLGLVGESGCGKTTLGKSILGLVEPTDGEMVYDFGKDVGEFDLRSLPSEYDRLAHQRIQIVFQDPYSSLNPAFTIYQSLSDPLKVNGVKTKEERRQIIGDLLEAVNLRREYMDRFPHEFSGGQRQRIGVARALSVNPEMVVCDEAVSALDVSIQAQVLNLLIKLREERGLTYIFISHNLSVVEYISDRIAVMYLGRIVELANTNQLFTKTLHPYTQALISAIPIVDPERKSSRIVLEGDVPSPANPPSGCNFHPRCQYCMDICTRERPPLKKHIIDGQEHFVACHYVEKNI